MRRLFLAAGVASLAIAGAAAAKPGEGHGEGGGGNPHGGGGPPAFSGGGERGGGHGGEHGGAPQGFEGGGGRGQGGEARVFMGGGERGRGGGGFAPMYGRGGEGGQGHGRGEGFRAPQMRAFEQEGRGRGGQREFRGFAGGDRHWGRQQEFGGRQARGFAERGHSGERFASRQVRAFAEGGRGHGGERFNSHQARAFAGNGHGQERLGRGFGPRQDRGFEGQQARVAQQLRSSGMQPVQQQALANERFNGSQLSDRNGLRGNVAQFSSQQPAFAPTWNGVSPYQSLAYGNNVQILPVQQVQQFVGVPLATAAGYAPMAPLPANIQYLYPDTSDYYYRWGDGYLYQVDRTDNLIAALMPLLGGGYLPGQYLPQPYMASYVPSSYGFNSFYPDDGDLCNRYYDGVIYQVDCSDGYVENVIPMYAGGYGVGQLLPSAYTYYNVPVQYRSLYYDTPDYGYWYAPGAIYQYDPRKSVITSVAALMSPGFSVGQPLPVGYDVYNVPYDYRATYYDTADAWYRYSNGYIYQVDPVTQVVTAIVASLLT